MTGFINILDLCLVGLGCLIVKRLLTLRNAAPLPPGPRALPILGNLLDMPKEKDWLTFAKWGEQWGGITSVTVFGQVIIVLNSAEAAVNMLEKKSILYSDRPILQMAGELVGWKKTLVLLPYGDRFRNYRRHFHQLMGSQSSVKKFHPAQEIETHRFLRRVLDTPENLSSHIRLTAGAIILRVSHGYEVKEENDPILKTSEIAMEEFSIASTAGLFMVDLLPFLKYVPGWLPGAGFQRQAQIWKVNMLRMVDEPHDWVKQQLAAGTAKPSFSSALLEEKNVSPEEEDEIRWTAASIYGGTNAPHLQYNSVEDPDLPGAAETTVAAIYSLFLAMARYPEVQKKAQAEIDTVIGNERLPCFADRETLPYTEALLKEVLRWHSVGPVVIPHRPVQDDIHGGYLIPKGSLVISNVWQMTHDPRVYANPMEFNPDRYIAGEGKTPEADPRNVCFGFGRRICPGRLLAEASIWISCATTLAVFNITKTVENGVVIEPVVDQTSGIISHPKPFKCLIMPRSERAVVLIRSNFEERVVDATTHM